MGNLKSWLESKLFWLRTGINVVEVNGGNPVEEVVIRYKDFWFMVLIDVESGEPTGDFSWSQGGPMTHVPIREHYKTVREGKE